MTNHLRSLTLDKNALEYEPNEKPPNAPPASSKSKLKNNLNVPNKLISYSSISSSFFNYEGTPEDDLPITRGRSNTNRYKEIDGEGRIAFEGYLMRRTDILHYWKTNYFVLKGNTLAYYDTREDFIDNIKLRGKFIIKYSNDENDINDNNNNNNNNTTDISNIVTKKKLNRKNSSFRNSITINNNATMNITNNNNNNNNNLYFFKIKSEGHRQFYLASRTSFEKEQWLRAIYTSSKEYENKEKDKDKDKEETNSISSPPLTSSSPSTSFASKSLDIPIFYNLLSNLLQEKQNDFPSLFAYIHPDIVLSSNYASTVPFWGRYRRYDGLLLFFSILLETVQINHFEMTEIIHINDNNNNNILNYSGSDISVDQEDPLKFNSKNIQKIIVITGKETFLIKNIENRKITQLFVHKLCLDYKNRLIRWHINGDSVAVSVAFDICSRGNGLRLHLPGERTPVIDIIPKGTFYIQILRAQKLFNTNQSSNDTKTNYSTSFYVRCIIDKGESTDRTLDGYNITIKKDENEQNKIDCSTSNNNNNEKSFINLNKSKKNKNKNKMNGRKRLFRGLRRATGTSGERSFAEYDDPSGCVTHICRNNNNNNPEWLSNLRLAFPGSLPGMSHYLRLEVYQSRFMMNDILVGVSKINLTPYLNMIVNNCSPETRATGALPTWFNLSDQYNDCKEWWAPPTVFRGKLQVSIVYTTQEQGILHTNINDNLNSTNHPINDHASLYDNNINNQITSITTDAVRNLYSLKDTNNDGNHDKTTLSSILSETGNINRKDVSNVTLDNNNKISKTDKSNDKDAKDDDLSTKNHIILVESKKNIDITFHIPKRYQLIKMIGSGAYGNVIAASDLETGTTLAIKKITNAFKDLLDTKRILREIRLLKQLYHPNLIRLFDVLEPNKFTEFEDIYFITDLMETDLHRVIYSTQTLSDEHVTHFLYQILRSLKYLHSANILHRDLKPSNILITSQCDIKVCDLGLARAIVIQKNLNNEEIKTNIRNNVSLNEKINKDNDTESISLESRGGIDTSDINIVLNDVTQTQKSTKPEKSNNIDEIIKDTINMNIIDDKIDGLTEYVVTRWYRAPEILLDGTKYGAAIDIWSAGCILAELLRRKPLFPGTGTLNQLNRIFNILGTPDDTFIDGLIKKQAKKWIRNQNVYKKQNFKDLFPNVNELALDLLQKMLVYDAKERITATEALKHPYFVSFGYIYNDEIDKKVDTFVGTIDTQHENVDETSKLAMQNAIFEDICYFNPNAKNRKNEEMSSLEKE